MRDKFILFAQFALLLAMACFDDASAAQLPKDHPIYQDRPGMRYARVLWSHKIGAKWTFRLNKKRVLVGEPIWGTVTVTNTSEKRDIVFSPPIHSLNVATLSIWRSQWIVDKSGGNWGPVTEVLYGSAGIPGARRGVGRRRGWHLGGEPTVLAPGKSAQFVTAVNVAQPGATAPGTSQSHGWMAGIGCAQPGKYRFYLRYANWEWRWRYRYRYEKTGRGPRGNTLRIEYPSDRVVLGPFDVEVVSVDKGFDRRLSRVVETFKNNQTSDDIGELGPIFDKLIAWPRLKKPGFESVRNSLRLSAIRNHLGRYYRPESSEYKTRWTKAESDLRQLLADTRPGPFADAVRLTKARVLWATGRHKQALKLASSIKSHDSQVFLDDARLYAKLLREGKIKPPAPPKVEPLHRLSLSVPRRKGLMILGEPVPVHCVLISRVALPRVRAWNVHSGTPDLQTVRFHVKPPGGEFREVKAPVSPGQRKFWRTSPSKVVEVRTPLWSAVELAYDWSDPKRFRPLFAKPGEYTVYASYHWQNPKTGKPEPKVLTSNRVTFRVAGPKKPAEQTRWDAFSSVKHPWLAYAPEAFWDDPKKFAPTVAVLRGIAKESPDSVLGRLAAMPVAFADYAAAKKRGDETEMQRIGKMLQRWRTRQQAYEFHRRVSQPVVMEVRTMQVLESLRRLREKANKKRK